MSFFSGRRQSEDVEHSDKTETPRPYPQQPIGFESVLGTSADLEGKLSSKGNVRLDGTFTGTLEIEGNILVGETAIINADIEARNISIAGAVRGNVTGNKVQLLRTGRIWGDIRAAALTTEEGAFIDGRITMIGHEATQSGKLPADVDSLSDTEPNDIAPEEIGAPLPEVTDLEADEESADLHDDLAPHTSPVESETDTDNL
ncbi:polymer-forming cytoskeletal protein [Phototrophicus methaneseepsis]|uniref:Polymer-forming cytoskeletal protein n=1 Tax=Phototrophicus methaneseepsis TaxID=2710758 RepID=A0A7S8EDM0_9CHLR|nr:polymer-forming cytoskeletal protein [Phototrophicus methaneseepsis]QPC85042.1 polymer-forming cytoskeletal protein [Phototrophicus methaneseepsis]